MPKSTSIQTVLISAAAVAALFSGLGWLAYSEGWIQFNAPSGPSSEDRLASSQKGESEENITFLCEANYSVPTNGLEGPNKVYKEMMAAGLDYKNKAGWYQGIFSISESRKGAMVLQGDKAVVSRPAMFERFGVMVTSEQFTLNRSTGEFTQSLTIKDGRKIEIIHGYCGKLTKAPF
jgi:hypothetical protein